MLQLKFLYNLKFCFQIWRRGVFGCWKDAILQKCFSNKAVWADTVTPKWHFLAWWKAAMLTQAGSRALPVPSTGLCGHSCERRERRQQLLWALWAAAGGGCGARARCPGTPCSPRATRSSTHPSEHHCSCFASRRRKEGEGRQKNNLLLLLSRWLPD